MDADAVAAGAEKPTASQLTPAAESGHRVEAKRRRRKKLTRGFGELRAVVPAASGADRGSLLSDAVSHIKHLVGRVEELEEDAGNENSLSDEASSAALPEAGGEAPAGVEVEVSMLGPDTAVVMVASWRSLNDPTTKLLKALSEMGVEVKHATASEVNGLMVQNVVVRLLAPGEIAGDGEWLKAAIISAMNQR